MYRMGKRTGMEPAKDGTIADGWNKRRGMESAQRDEKPSGGAVAESTEDITNNLSSPQSCSGSYLPKIKIFLYLLYPYTSI